MTGIWEERYPRIPIYKQVLQALFGLVVWSLIIGSVVVGVLWIKK